MQQLVLKNQVVIGSVNAGVEHYNTAVEYLEAAHEKWPEAIRQVITEKVPAADFKLALEHHSVDEIKVVIEWV